MRMPRIALSTALTVLVTVCLPPAVFAQTYTATVTGTVVDAGGAAVPDFSWHERRWSERRP